MAVEVVAAVVAEVKMTRLVIPAGMTKKAKLKVMGMHCKSCETLIQDVLWDANVKANANHKTGEVNVEYDESKISMDKIKSLIDELGYKVKN